MEAKSCFDHTGVEHPSVTAMCEYWGVSTAAYYMRLQKGWTLEEALSPYDPARDGRTKVWVDHEGRVYPSKKAMCEVWGIKVGTFEQRLSRGWSLEEALVGRPNKPRVLKSAGKAPKQPGKEMVTPNADCKVCSASAAARGGEKIKPSRERRRA